MSLKLVRFLHFFFGQDYNTVLPSVMCQDTVLEILLSPIGSRNRSVDVKPFNPLLQIIHVDVNLGCHFFIIINACPQSIPLHQCTCQATVKQPPSSNTILVRCFLRKQKPVMFCSGNAAFLLQTEDALNPLYI